MTHQVFISYASSDKQIADSACAYLEAENIRCWIAPRDVVPGTSYGEALVEAIGASRLMILIFSSGSNHSQHVMRELERAASKSIPILPFRIEVVEPSKDVEFFVSRHHWLDALPPPIEPHLGKLVVAVRHLLGRQGTAPAEVAEAQPTFKSVLADPRALVGHTVGPYVLREPIGSGGSGIVYRGWNSHVGQEVCIKISYPIRKDIIGAMAIATQSARALFHLHHPNVVRVFDQGRFELADGASFYVVMEYVQGETLDRWIDRNTDVATTLVDRVEIARQMTDALQAAHAFQTPDEVGFARPSVLHGDIKPANVIVRQNGSVVVTDFGMLDATRLVDRSAVPSAVHQGVPVTAAFGTPGYMAPEQEKSGFVSTSTDIFALGMTFYDLFFPRRMFPLGLHEGHAAPSMSTIAGLIRSMVAEEPASRPRDMRTVLVALEEITRQFIVEVDAQCQAVCDLRHSLPGSDDSVAFGASAPANYVPGIEFVTRFMCYSIAQKEMALEEMLKRSTRQAIRMDVVKTQIAVGTRVGVRLRAPAARIRKSLQTFVWKGVAEILEYEVVFPRDSMAATRYLVFEVLINGLQIASFSVDVELTDSIQRKPAKSTLDVRFPRHVFASYAHKDRARVLDHVGGVKTLTNIEVFTDCLTLRNGDHWQIEIERMLRTSEKLWLFWSRHARASSWVEFEWKKTLDLHGLHAIVPQALESTQMVPPPPELSALHFSDTIAHIRKSLTTRRWWGWWPSLPNRA